ncbi:MAG: glycosyltransferase, partial [Alphaproteobacteria bacterium]|nr:glycosyltransferase [Alphaproteobacteria bacterium]
MIKVSVIVPVYNTEKYLPKCLDSLIAQTLKDIEIICINDASTDGSLKILQEYALRDNRIKIIDFKQNKGAGAARNTGIDTATGEYIGFVDSDDFVDLDFYEKLYNKAVEQNADAVKGNIYDVDAISGKTELTDFYDMNDKIRENAAYFYYGFTSAIYKRDFINAHQIRFPEGIKYFEDPYFSIKACLNYKTLACVDDAKYYYLQYGQASVSNHMTMDNLKNFECVASELLPYMADGHYSKEAYMTVFDFLYHFALGNAFNRSLEKEIRAYVLDVLAKMVINCKYDFDIDVALFRSIKNEIYNNKFYDILFDAYKKYDGLNEHQSFVKILVGYIKPSFLFNTDVLTPIHLGRAVEKDDSKDGVQNEENIKWLHENCLSDDFEGSISKLNRRIGFLTGTYWAWKNYDKLGNPAYFGSFGYRKLMFPSCLENLEQYDFVLPKEMAFRETLEKQFIGCHGRGYYNMIMDAIEHACPEDLNGVKEYMQRYSGYYAEMYVMKKDIFFDFCNWIFKIIQYLCEKYPHFVAPVVEGDSEEDYTVMSLINKFNSGTLARPERPTKKDVRDLAFILERVSGYYFYELTLNKNLKYHEVNVFEPNLSCSNVYQLYKELTLSQMRK